MSEVKVTKTELQENGASGDTIGGNILAASLGLQIHL